MHQPFPLPADRHLIVTGSLQAKDEDRTHRRDEIQPVTVVTDDGCRPVPFFQAAGELGVSSMAFWDERTLYWSTGADLFRLDLDRGDNQTIGVPNLIDVHEMSLIDGVLWLANTGADELVSVEPGRDHRVDRIPLAPFRGQSKPSKESVDRFHTNQVFADPDGRLLALVHHASGRQLLRRIQKRLLKSHGNGGVIDLGAGRAIDLSLTAPHSATRVDDSWWICDSGKAEMAVFDSSWQRTATIGTAGWGRGAALTDDGAVLYVGLSPIRSRYRSTVSTAQISEPAVQAIGTADRDDLGLVTIADIEQVNNVYLVPAELTKRLADLSS